jgi:hypothetical protein
MSVRQQSACASILGPKAHCIILLETELIAEQSRPLNLTKTCHMLLSALGHSAP